MGVMLFFTSVMQAQNKTEIADTTFVNLKDFSDSFVYDMKYAAEDNFLKTAVYDCGECYLRYKTVKSLLKAQEAFLNLGYRIKIFDCYRPLDVQKKMFKIVPNPVYVANPATGSIHNRGCAVDITLVDTQGNELDMGTEFDHFGKESAHEYKNLDKKVIENRLLLKNTMEKNGFGAIKSEWWHYNLAQKNRDSVSNFKWDCD